MGHVKLIVIVLASVVCVGINGPAKKCYKVAEDGSKKYVYTMWQGYTNGQMDTWVVPDRDF